MMTEDGRARGGGYSFNASPALTLAFLQRRNVVRRVLADQEDIACANAVSGSASQKARAMIKAHHSLF